MKKAIVIVLAFLVVLAFVGCSSKPAEEVVAIEPTETISVEAESQTPEPIQEATVNPFVLDGAYYCLRRRKRIRSTL